MGMVGVENRALARWCSIKCHQQKRCFLSPRRGSRKILSSELFLSAQESCPRTPPNPSLRIKTAPSWTFRSGSSLASSASLIRRSTLIASLGSLVPLFGLSMHKTSTLTLSQISTKPSWPSSTPTPLSTSRSSSTKSMVSVMSTSSIHNVTSCSGRRMS